MLAVEVARTGGPDVLELVERPTPTPGPGQVLIRHEAIGLNFIDTYFRSGLYPAKLPFTPGAEGAGVVEAVGEGVVRFAVGDRAAYTGAFGGYAEYAVVAADRAVHVPAGVGSELAAAALLKGMTTEAFIRRCYRVQAGQTVLVHAAAGGVGQIMTQWLHHLGAVVVATVGSADKAQRVRELGADHVVLYREQDVAAEVRRITGGAGVPVAYDSVGAATFEGTMASLARRGVFVSFGNASGPAPEFAPARLQRGGSLFITRPTLNDYIVATEELDASAAALFAVMASGAVKVEIGQTFPLRDARAAHQALEARQTTGSTLLLP